MAKILNATCEDGVVKVFGVEVPNALILSAGVKSSVGFVLLDQDMGAIYIASNAGDLELTLEKILKLITDLASAVTTIANTLTAIGAGMTGPTTAPPPTLLTSVADINAKVASINQTKSELEELKGDLA